jgi:hypothetical protein
VLPERRGRSRGAVAAHAAAIDLPRAFLRSEFVKVSAVEEFNGLPIDMQTYRSLGNKKTWDEIRESLIPAIDADYHVYDGRVFKRDWFDRYLAQHGIPWSRRETGQLDLKTKTFRELAI